MFRFISATLIVLLLMQPLYAAEPQKAKRVLVLFSEDKAHPAHEMTERGIREVFGSNKLFDVQLFTEYLDVSRFGGISHARTMAEYLRRKYSGMDIHAIIAVYPAAVDFLLAERRELFPEVAIIASEMTDKDYVEKLERSPARRFLTGTIIEDDITALIDAALHMRPKTKHFALVAGTAPNDIFGETAFRTAFRPFAGRVDLIDLTKLPLAETLSRVGSLPADSLVMYETMFRDGAGKIFVPREALTLISRTSKVPVFGLYESYLGFGIVGGRLSSFEMHGKEAATMALRIMGGESPASISFGGDQAYVTAYDWRELKRWNIPETTLTAGAEIRFRTFSFWESYKMAIIGTLCLIVIETCLIFGLLISIRRRREAERSLRASEERVMLAVSSAGAGLWSIDIETGHIWATDRVLELFDFAPEQSLNYENLLTHIHHEDREKFRLSIKQAVESRVDAILEYRVVLSDGNIRWLTNRGHLQTDSPGKSKHLMGITVDITERKLAEESLRQNENELIALTGRLIYTQEEELRRLSRDLHDDLTQRLAVLAIDAGVLEKALRPMQPQASQELMDLKTRLIEVSNEVHNLSRQLHPSILEDLGLVQAIQSACDEFSRRTGIAVSFEPDDISVSFPKTKALCLYRVLQEGLQNISKHSLASQARIVLQDSSDGVSLSIHDSGIGFDLKQIAGKGTIGLSSMRERIRMFNGTLSVVSEPGKGTEIRVFIPNGGTHA